MSMMSSESDQTCCDDGPQCPQCLTNTRFFAVFDEVVLLSSHLRRLLVRWPQPFAMHVGAASADPASPPCALTILRSQRLEPGGGSREEVLCKFVDEPAVLKLCEDTRGRAKYVIGAFCDVQQVIVHELAGGAVRSVLWPMGVRPSRFGHLSVWDFSAASAASLNGDSAFCAAVAEARTKLLNAHV